MTDILQKIIETKKTEVAQLKADMPVSELHHEAASAPAPAGFRAWSGDMGPEGKRALKRWL